MHEQFDKKGYPDKTGSSDKKRDNTKDQSKRQKEEAECVRAVLSLSLLDRSPAAVCDIQQAQKDKEVFQPGERKALGVFPRTCRRTRIGRVA